MSTREENNVFGNEPVADRLNVRREVDMFRDDPLAALLGKIPRPDHHELLIDEVSRWEQAWKYYQQSFARLIPAIAAALRWSSGPYWAEREGRRFTEHERRVARRYRELRPFLDLDFANFLIHARILCDRVAGLARYFLRAHPHPSFTSFADHRAFFEKGRHSARLARYGNELLSRTEWFDMPLKYVRDKVLIHTGPRHMPTFGHSNAHDLELVLFVPDGDDHERPLARTKIITVSARRLARDIHAFLEWFNTYGLEQVRGTRT